MSTPLPLAEAPPQPPRLLDLVRQVARTRFGQDGPGERYAHWTRRLVLFHDQRHPRDLSPGDVGRFLEHVAHTETDALNCLEEASGAGSSPCGACPQRRHAVGRRCSTWSGRSNGRVWRRWPGCPPLGRSPRGRGGDRLSAGPSLDGGLLELVEFCPSRPSSSRTRRSKAARRCW
jgi:integrase-like protein